MGERISDLGEFGLIRRLVEKLPPGAGVILGPGDDAAVIDSAGSTLVATADLLVEGTHFDLAFSSPLDVGFKALAANVSDVAAMGSRPRWALVSIGAPPETDVETADGIYDGLVECARAFDVAIVGGDTVRADRLVISISLLGEPGPGGPVRRAGARPGDLLCVTGTLGGAAAGLELLRAPGDARAAELAEAFPSLLAAHRRGRARPSEGQAAAAAGARAMIDISDGLAADVNHLCEASGCGALVDVAQLPAADGVAEVERWRGIRAGTLALRGGDDYELAIAIPIDLVDEVELAIAPTPLTTIGRFVEERTLALRDADGGVFPLDVLGWDNLS